jgi:hypothetical protein
MPDGSTLVIGQNNTGDTGVTRLERLGTTAKVALDVINNGAEAGLQVSGTPGIRSSSATGNGVRATSGSGTGLNASSTSGSAVVAVSDSGIGVSGRSNGAADGVRGQSATGVGVEGSGYHGVVGTSVGGPGVGIAGIATSGLGMDARSVDGDGAWGISTRGVGVYGQSTDYIGVEGFAPLKAGVRGGSQDGPGVLGDSDRGAGVFGLSHGQSPGVFGTAAAAGVRGESSNIGVQGTSKDYAGVVGTGPAIGTAGVSTAGTGVNGSSTSGMGVSGSSTSGQGVRGLSTTASGVRGESVRGIGVDGVSTFNHGVSGITQASRATATGNIAGVNGMSVLDKFGVRGISLGSQVFRVGGVIGLVGAGVLAETLQGTALLARIPGGPRGTGLAGAFLGEVVVDGNFTVFTGAKSAAVRHPDGSHRRLYSLESPESFFEDFGRTRLRRGKAAVRLDPDFAALVRREDYYVFLTAEGPTQGLYVSRKTRNGFEVTEQGEGKGTLSFCYRIVARRKDIAGRRLEKVPVPRFEGPDVSRREARTLKVTRPVKVSGRLEPSEPMEAPEVARLPRRRGHTAPSLRGRTARQQRRKSPPKR